MKKKWKCFPKKMIYKFCNCVWKTSDRQQSTFIENC